MEFTITKAELETILKYVDKVWGNKDKPIMDCLYFKVDANGTNILRASNGYQTMETEFVATVVNDGEACIDAYTLTKIIKTFKEGDITIQKQATGESVDIFHPSGQIEIAGVDPSQFPPYMSVQEDASFVIDEKDLKDAFDHVKFAALKNPIGSDAKLGGVGFTVANGKVLLACTDRRRIAKYEFNAPSASDTQVVLPTDTLDVLPSSSGNVNVKISDAGVEIETSRLKYRSSVLAQAFPDVTKFFSMTPPITALVPVDELKKVLERIVIISKASKVSADAEFAFGPTGLKIEYKPNGGRGKVDEVIPVSGYNGNPMNMTFNVDIIIDAVNRIEKNARQKNVEFELHASNKPALIYAENEREFGFLALAIV